MGFKLYIRIEIAQTGGGETQAFTDRRDRKENGKCKLTSAEITLTRYQITLLFV
jgi:hypothetical protein